MSPPVYVFPDHLSGKQGACCLRTHDHERGGSEYSVHDRVEDESVESVDGWDMAEVGGVREGHGNVERGHREGCDEIALEIGPFVLADPVTDRDVVEEIPTHLLARKLKSGYCGKGRTSFESA